MRQASLPLFSRGCVTRRHHDGSVSHVHTARMYASPVVAFQAAHRLARFIGEPIRPLTLSVVKADAVDGLVVR